MSVKSSINLLQPELLPEKHLLTLPNVVGAWVLTALVMFGLSIYTGWQHQDAKAQKVSPSFDKIVGIFKSAYNPVIEVMLSQEVSAGAVVEHH